MKELKERIEILRSEVEQEEKSFPAVEEKHIEEYDEMMKRLSASEEQLERLKGE